MKENERTNIILSINRGLKRRGKEKKIDKVRVKRAEENREERKKKEERRKKIPLFLASFPFSLFPFPCILFSFYFSFLQSFAFFD